jgi:hypothetical protein
MADCSQVLQLTGRNLMTSLSQKDRQAYFYKNICGSSDTSFGGSFKDLQSTFGFNYGSKEDFCQKESSRLANHEFDYLSTSVVVDKALTVFSECKKLDREKIATAISLSPDHVSIDVSRAGATTGYLYGWKISTGLKCSLVRPGTAAFEPVQEVQNLNYELPIAEQVSVSCARDPLPSTVESGSRYYPAVNLTVFTSEGSITFPIPAEARVGETWASDVEAKLKKYDAILASLNTIVDRHAQLVAQLKAEKASGVRLVITRETDWKTTDRGVCNDDEVMVQHGVRSYSGVSATARYVRCARLEIDRK